MVSKYDEQRAAELEEDTRLGKPRPIGLPEAPEWVDPWKNSLRVV